MRILASPEVLAKTGTTGFKILNRDKPAPKETCQLHNTGFSDHIAYSHCLAYTNYNTCNHSLAHLGILFSHGFHWPLS